ncbi:MAG TPA: hypothetical protein PKD91_10045 [Bacteroidia bacterium]|nr:hypothetical protein [Bacteroidia bacterium]
MIQLKIVLIPFLSLLLMLNLFSMTVCSQSKNSTSAFNKNSKISATVSIGYLKPIGEFAEISNNDYDTYNLSFDYKDFNMAGKATSGFSASSEVAYRLIKNFELGIYLDYSITYTTPATFRELFDLDSTSELSVSSTSGNWETFSPMATAAYCFYYHKWKGSIQLMAGWQFAWSPEVTMNREFPETGTFNGIDRYHITYTQPTRKSNAFCYGASAKLRYSINNKIGVVLSGNYQYAEHEFNKGGTLDYKSSIMTPQGVVNTVVTTRGFNFSKTIEYYTINAGVSFAF